MKTESIISHLEKIAEAVDPVAQARLAAAIVYKNSIVSIGINKKKSHPFQSRFTRHPDAIMLHAENDAIINALRHISLDELAKSKLFVARVRYKSAETNLDKSNLQRAMARPCAGCQRAIANFNIKKVCYTCDDGNIDWM